MKHESRPHGSKEFEYHPHKLDDPQTYADNYDRIFKKGKYAPQTQTPETADQQETGGDCVSRLVRPLPISGEADCPQCHAEKSVARHNADWTCHKCGFHEVTDPDREANYRMNACLSHGDDSASPTAPINDQAK